MGLSLGLSPQPRKGTSFEVRATYFSYESSSPSAISTGHTDGALSACRPSSRLVALSMMKTMPASPSPLATARPRAIAAAP